ncbi:hypothetical protein, partial [Acidaminococcus timonensis]|uniref:hypothetical protein n=1 Tax=Acidaminococcus timonensis TaxID=1871002 RepID=UPI0025DC4093
DSLVAKNTLEHEIVQKGQFFKWLDFFHGRYLLKISIEIPFDRKRMLPACLQKEGHYLQFYRHVWKNEPGG